MKKVILFSNLQINLIFFINVILDNKEGIWADFPKILFFSFSPTLPVFSSRMFAKEVEEERQSRNMMDKVLDISVKEALIQVCRALMVLPF